MKQNEIGIISFSSVRDYVELEPQGVNKGFFERDIDMNIRMGSHHMVRWYGSLTMEEVRKICKEGWVEGLKTYERVKRSLPEIEISGEFHKKYKKKKKYSDSGDEVDIDKYIHGEFDSMYIDYNKCIQDKEGKIITIYTSLGFSHIYSSSQAIWNGITSMVLTDIFESVGYRVHLIGFCAVADLFVSSEHPKKTQIDIDIKLPNQSLDILSLLTAIAYPGFFRYYGFKALCASPYAVRDSLGRAIQFPHIFEKNSFVIGNVWNSRDAYLKALQIINSVKERRYSCS